MACTDEGSHSKSLVTNGILATIGKVLKRFVNSEFTNIILPMLCLRNAAADSDNIDAIVKLGIFVDLGTFQSTVLERLSELTLLDYGRLVLSIAVRYITEAAAMIKLLLVCSRKANMSDIFDILSTQTSSVALCGYVCGLMNVFLP